MKMKIKMKMKKPNEREKPKTSNFAGNQNQPTTKTISFSGMRRAL